MAASAAYILLIALATAGSVRGQGDLTKVSGANGEAVVEAVVDRIRSNCILSDDKLFLRRLAYVESRDGTDPKTYRPGYYGGIWQVDQDKLNVTLSCSRPISLECDVIQAAFGIDWTKVTWPDLRKPLYSGLAAALYITQRYFYQNTMGIPGTLEDQGQFWARYYHLGSPSSNFSNVARELTQETVCDKIDLAFVLDSSGSIDMFDYYRMLNFTRQMVAALDIGPDKAQVGSVVYGSFASVPFYLNTYHDKTSLQNALSRIIKDDGGTDTASALDLTRDRIFSEYNGARRNVPKVAMLLTDGASSSFYETVRAAKDLRDAGVIIFAVGVGSPNVRELHAVASDPNCTHVILLESFTDINSILHTMTKDSCRAPVDVIFLPQNGSSVNGSSTNGDKTVTIIQPIGSSGNQNNTNNPNGTSITAPVKSVQTLKVDSDNSGNSSTGTNQTDATQKVLVAKTDCGIVELYTSYNTPNPGPAFYDQKAVAMAGKAAIMHFEKDVQGRPLYITVVGTKLPGTAGEIDMECNYNLTIAKQLPVTVVCKEGGRERECGPTDLVTVCDTKSSGVDLTSEIPNPCTRTAIERGDLDHPYPLDNTFFIRCNLQGEMYITKCPNNKLYNVAAKRCGFDTGTSTGTGTGSVTTGGGELRPGDVNPCTAANILSGLYFFAYPRDKHKYIHCDVWGKAWLQDCYPGHIWIDTAHTCAPDDLHEFDKTTINPLLHNPCTQAAIKAGQLFFPYAGDKTKYIHCDVAGNYYVQSCFVGGEYDPVAHVCIWAIVG